MTRATLCLLLLATALPAFAAKPCEELKAEIAAKLDAKGVTGYMLDVVATADVGDKKVDGSCEAGSKKIVYTRK